MSFRAGQRVRVIAGLLPEHMKFLGAIGTIVSNDIVMKEFRGEHLVCQDVRWESGAGEWNGQIGTGEPVKCLAPIDDDADFKRFMERVLKPVPLPKEIHA